ncbi:MAG: MarR family winged helix-turn-helix transcriptional regulator [Rhizobiaceae bacterium]
MTSGIDPDSFGFLVNDVARLTRQEFDRRTLEAGFGLTPGDGRTLSHVGRADGARQNVLAERMGVEAMTLSGALDRLEARGLVLRQADPADRRAKLVSLTEAGAELLSQLQPIGASLRKDAAAGLDAPEWASLIDMLKRVRTNLQRARSEGQRRDDAA